MNLSSFFRVVSRVSGMARGRMGVMGRLLVMASFVVLGSFTVMAGCVGMMLRSLADGEPITFAGLWDEWKDKATGEILHDDHYRAERLT
jgi:hypothetical protein